MPSTIAVTQPVLEISPSAVAQNPAWDADWAHELLEFARSASSQGLTITVEAADRLYSPKQAALAAHVSRATILRRIADGTIAATKRGTHWRIKQADLDSYRAAVLEQTAAMMADDW